ncbi:hypothetical protein MSAN_01356700 [Mycena sanguinolenta]|uniref:Uncharacterized protein n=1 Tax=Mycena sanguinolenta TaxID=230812 RepID=A0A8H6YAU0_9AGAR|nr:hypothetical protein MSAN_01356700 [Mycena sanguinolenta]
MDHIEFTGLMIALVAFIIALLQLIQQYLATATVRSKVGRAAIGRWATHNRRRWNLWEYKVHDEYLEPTLTWDAVCKCLHSQQKKGEAVIWSLRGRYAARISSAIVVGPQGDQFSQAPRLELTRWGDESQTEVPLSALSRADRRQVQDYNRTLAMRARARQTTSSASWSNMMAALVGDSSVFAAPSDAVVEIEDNDIAPETSHLMAKLLSTPRKQTIAKLTTKLRRKLVEGHRDAAYRDADTIPSLLDSPTMDIHMSDLVACGLALDAEIIRADLHRPVIHMTGKHCSITSQEESGVGIIARYRAKPGHVHDFLGCTATEAEMLVDFAKGYLRIGDAQAYMTDWGYNSVDKLFEIALRRSQSEDWEQMAVMPEYTPYCEGDQDHQWRDNWSSPKTPLVGFLMTVCGNPAVANSFPHTLLREWTDSERTAIGQRVCQYIDQEIGFIDAPTNFLVNLRSAGVFMANFKLANDWGAEHAGIHGWSMSSGTEFVKRVSECWSVSGQSEQVPIMPALRNLLEDGRLNLDWAKAYNSKMATKNQREGRVKAGTLCWIQIMMLDTWIARQVDLLILKDSDEAAIPVDLKTAKERAKPSDMSGDEKRKTTGWKRCRSRFIRLYLARLADGIVIDSDPDGPQSVGVSCMSPGGGLGATGWEGMETGDGKDWAELDAVLTLRAVLMATRMELMYNTDVFLALRDFDPMIRMA